jgi:hypothetical protein
LQCDLIFSIAYKFDDQDNWQFSTSQNAVNPLSFAIKRTGSFRFTYVVQDLSGNSNRNTDNPNNPGINKIDFFQDWYPVFELYFYDVSPPKLTMENYQTNPTGKTIGDYFTVPQPNVKDNSDYGYILDENTRVWIVPGTWEKGDSLPGAGCKEITDDEDLFKDGRFLLDKAGYYHFAVYYQARDEAKNKTTPLSLKPDGTYNEDAYLFKISVEVREPEANPQTTALIVWLIIVGVLSLAGIVALIFVKPIDDATVALADA